MIGPNSPQSNTRTGGLELFDTLLQNVTVTTEATAGAVTYSAAVITGGLILRDPNGAGRADLFPTASNMYTELGGPAAGSSFTVTIRNTADAAETITMTTNTGLTLSGTMTIEQNNTKSFLVVFATPSTATVYSLGTVVH